MKKIALILKMIVLIIPALFLSCESSRLPLMITSPDENLEVMISLDEAGIPNYSISYNKRIILKESSLSLQIKNWDKLAGFNLIGTDRISHHNEYEMIVGKSKQVENHYNQLTVKLEASNLPGKRVNLIFRLFNDGAAIRYHIPEAAGIKDFQLVAENTEFQFVEDQQCWALQLENYTTSYESEFKKITIDSILPGSLLGLPLVIEIKDGPFVALTEANLTDYSGMYLSGLNKKPHTLVSKLSPSPDGGNICVTGSTPFDTPWRVLMMVDSPGDLIESDIILNLNEPCALADVSWIKPGKVAWPWWSGRVVTGVDFKGGVNTATQKHYIDFATEYGLEYLLIDAKWYGPHKDPTQDITTTIPEIDLPDIIDYARSRNVDVMLWLNWQNTRDQMDKAFPLYEKWGIKGVKIDYMNRDDQEMVKFYHHVIKKAAEHHLLVDFHGAYKPTGIRRTYPNLMTREGVLGLEHVKWSKRVTPEHNVTLPFTRMITGSMDYTPGAFNNVTKDKFISQYESPMAVGTRCHHLAMYVVYESPLQMCTDYPGAYRNQAGSDFLRHVPASWDETKVLAGKIGEYIAIARKFKNEWYIGIMTGWESRTLTLPLNFLESNTYQAVMISDGEDANVNPKSVKIETLQFTQRDSVVVKLASGGGCVIHLIPELE
jgi:alpha-glucosidase